METARRTVELSFDSAGLLYDAANCAYVEGEILPEESPSHVRHIVQDLAEGGNADRAWRVLSIAHARAVELLYPYTKREVATMRLDDRAGRPAAWHIAMTVPEGFSQTTLDYLVKLVHDWLVCCVVHDWLSITHPEKASVWKAKSSELEEEIRGAVNMMRGVIRRKLHPF